MKRISIDASREARLWIGQVLVPATVLTIMIASNPNVRYYVKEKIDGIKLKLRKKKEKGQQ